MSCDQKEAFQSYIKWKWKKEMQSINYFTCVSLLRGGLRSDLGGDVAILVGYLCRRPRDRSETNRGSGQRGQPSRREEDRGRNQSTLRGQKEVGMCSRCGRIPQPHIPMHRASCNRLNPIFRWCVALYWKHFISGIPSGQSRVRQSGQE